MAHLLDLRCVTDTVVVTLANGSGKSSFVEFLRTAPRAAQRGLIVGSLDSGKSSTFTSMFQQYVSEALKRLSPQPNDALWLQGPPKRPLSKTVSPLHKWLQQGPSVLPPANSTAWHAWWRLAGTPEVCAGSGVAGPMWDGDSLHDPGKVVPSFQPLSWSKTWARGAARVGPGSADAVALSVLWQALLVGGGARTGNAWPGAAPRPVAHVLMIAGGKAGSFDRLVGSVDQLSGRYCFAGALGLMAQALARPQAHAVSALAAHVIACRWPSEPTTAAVFSAKQWPDGKFPCVEGELSAAWPIQVTCLDGPVGFGPAVTRMWQLAQEPAHRRLQSSGSGAFWAGQRQQWVDVMEAAGHLCSGAKSTDGDPGTGLTPRSSGRSQQERPERWKDRTGRWVDSRTRLITQEISKPSGFSDAEHVTAAQVICRRESAAGSVVLWLDIDMCFPLERDAPQGRHAVPTRLRYRLADPYAVEMVFHHGSKNEVSWTVARDLLVEGLRRPVGTGDVQVWRNNGDVMAADRSLLFISLSAPEGTAVLATEPVDVEMFLDETSRLVAYGSEHLKVEAALADWEANTLQHRI